MDARLARVELAVGDLRDIIEENIGHVDKLEIGLSSRMDETEYSIKELSGEFQGIVNEIIDRLSQGDAGIETMVVTFHEEVEELRKELTACRRAMGAGMIAAPQSTKSRFLSQNS